MQRGETMASIIESLNKRNGTSYKNPVLPKPVTVDNANVKPPSANLPTKPTEPTWQDKLASYQTNPNAARTELERAQNKANLQNATGDTEGYKASTHWMNQINTAIGKDSNPQVQQFNEYQKKQAELMNRFEGMMNQPNTYNPESDPRYQAYKKLYEKQAGVASQNAMETFNDRGILNSTVTSDRLGQIQQDAQQNALADIPEFYAQDQQAQQDRLRNTAQLLGLVTDEARNAQEVNYRNERDEVGDRRYNEQFTAQQTQQEWDNAFKEKGFDFNKAQQLWDNNFKNKSFEQGVKEFAQSNAMNWSRLSLQEREFVAEQAYKNEAMKLNREQFEFDKEQSSQDQSNVDINQEKQGLTDAIRSGQVTPGQAMQQIEQDKQLGFYSDQEAAALKAVVSQLAGFQGDQPKTAEQQQTEQVQREEIMANIPSDKEIEAEAAKLGYPRLDYRSYYKDPKGKTAGLSFEQWRSLYGPVMR
jgi:hypothetical protein